MVRGTITFATAAVLQRAAALLLLPVFARILTPAEFGEIGVVLTFATLLGTLVSFGLETAVFRGYIVLSRDTDAIRTFTNTVGLFGVVVPPLLAGFVAVVTAPALEAAFGVRPVPLIVGSVAAALTASATIIPLALLRAQERLSEYLRLSWGQLLVTVASLSFFVAVLQWGVLGWMIATAVTATLLLARSLAALGHRWTREFDLTALQTALAFGIPLVPHAAAHWGLAVSDRAVLGAIVPAAVVGTYYVAYLMTLPVNLVAIAISQATQPLHAEAAVSDRRRADLAKVIDIQVVVVVLAAVSVALLAPPAAKLLLPSEFAPATAFVPWLATGACLFGLYLIPMNAVGLMLGETRHVWAVTVIAATLNIALNLALVPRFGAMAAAANTIIGYGVLLGGVLVYARRRTRIPLDAMKVGVGAAALVVAALLASTLTSDQSFAGFTVRVAMLAAVCGGLVTIGPLRHEARAAFDAIRPARAEVHE